MSELTDRRHAETRQTILDAAMSLFVADGFDQTPMSAIASAAGVSRRTVYRHFPSKDDLIFEHPRRWLEAFQRVLATRGDEPTRDICRRALVAVGDVITGDADDVLVAFSILTATPSLRVRHSGSDALWAEMIADLIAVDLRSTPTLLPQAAIAAGALVGTTNAVVRVWAEAQPGADIRPILLAALDQVDSLWPDACREAPIGRTE